MAAEIEHDRVPGTEYLVDIDHTLEVSHAGHGTSDVVLLPQPTSCGSDPLTWSVFKRYYQLFLLALYALSFSYGENTLGAAWTTVSKETGVSLLNMNGGSALNYLLLGFGNILWIPLAMKIGRRPVFLLTTAICLGSAIWTGKFHGLAQWYLTEILNGVGTSAYQAVIQLSVFDTFFVHQRGKGLSFYLFGQQLGSILGLITGGSIADGPGWRWSQFIVAIIEGGVLVLMFFTFEETLFPRFLFPTVGVAPPAEVAEAGLRKPEHGELTKDLHTTSTTTDLDSGTRLPDFPERTFTQRLRLWTYFPQDRTTYWQYFRRPFFLFTFPTVVLVSNPNASKFN
jgi:MFS family permease